MTHLVVEIGYLVAAVCFILSLMWMSHPSTARRSVMAGELGMLLAIVGTLLLKEVIDYKLIAAALLLGSAIGAPLAYLMPMTAIPQRTALSHAFGALAVSLIAMNVRNILGLISLSASPWVTGMVFVSVIALLCAVGATLTGLIFILAEEDHT